MPDPAGWFFDSVTLSNFALADGLHILTARYRRRGFVTSQVMDELTRGVAAGYLPLAACLELVDKDSLRLVALDKAEQTTLRQLITHLGHGEAGTIAAAHHRQGVVVTDDRAARQTCNEMAIPLTGTIGILQASIRDHQLTLSDANGILHKMIEAGFHSPVKRLPG